MCLAVKGFSSTLSRRAKRKITVNGSSPQVLTFVLLFIPRGPNERMEVLWGKWNMAASFPCGDCNLKQTLSHCVTRLSSSPALFFSSSPKRHNGPVQSDPYLPNNTKLWKDPYPVASNAAVGPGEWKMLPGETAWVSVPCEQKPVQSFGREGRKKEVCVVGGWLGGWGVNGVGECCSMQWHCGVKMEWSVYFVEVPHFLIDTFLRLRHALSIAFSPLFDFVPCWAFRNNSVSLFTRVLVHHHTPPSPHRKTRIQPPS